MVGAGRVETVWKATDAATTGQSASALDDLDRLVSSGEAPVGLLAAMSASLRKVRYAGELRRRKRLDLGAACREAGVPTFPSAIEKVGQQHAHLGPKRVRDLPRQLLQADLDIKGSSTLPPRTILERLFVELARPRED
jgi:DNA polymerase-3 subunit delta